MVHFSLGIVYPWERLFEHPVAFIIIKNIKTRKQYCVQTGVFLEINLQLSVRPKPGIPYLVMMHKTCHTLLIV